MCINASKVCIRSTPLKQYCLILQGTQIIFSSDFLKQICTYNFFFLPCPSITIGNERDACMRGKGPNVTFIKAQSIVQTSKQTKQTKKQESKIKYNRCPSKLFFSAVHVLQLVMNVMHACMQEGGKGQM